MKKFSIFIALAVVFAITMSLALGCNSYATNKNLEVDSAPAQGVGIVIACIAEIRGSVLRCGLQGCRQQQSKKYCCKA